jgi:NAD(P)-dependent dehydrogenase (short-subunit alcohol dehydrogenase family)
MPDRFAHTVALVAGGTGGLGRAVSVAFLGEGAAVEVTYRDGAEFDALAGAAGPNSERLVGHRVDVTDETAVDDLVASIAAKHGRLDILINAVGAYAGGTPLWDTQAAVMERMLALNLRSGFVLSRAAARAMLPHRRGAIVNVASKAAFDHAAGQGAYAASKAAAVAMLAALAADLRGTGVRANSIVPSIIDTPANRAAMPGADFSKWPQADEIARVVLFLCSDDAKVVHGAAIPVYGGN